MVKDPMAVGLCVLLAGAFTLLDLFTAKYPTTWGMLAKRGGPYLYAAIYGLLAGGILFLFGGAIHITAPSGVPQELMDSPWTKAVALGIFTRSVMQMTLITMGTTPLGLKTLTLLFEPFFLRSFLLAEFRDVRAYVSPSAAKATDLATVKATIRANTPPALPEDERGAFLASIDKEETVLSAMERYLRFVGTDLFDATFPP